MKLKATIDLEPLRQRVLDTIDRHFSAQIPVVNPIYQRKVLWAQKQTDASGAKLPYPQALLDEAAMKKMSPETLAATILEAASASDKAIQAIETQRQVARIDAKNASSQQVLDAMLGTFAG